MSTTIDSSTSSTNVIGPALESGQFARFIPEPRNGLGTAFRGVLGAIGGIVQTGAEVAGGVSPSYAVWIEKQIEVQQQMQLVSLWSNIEKSKHETSMAAIRNIRAS